MKVAIDISPLQTGHKFRGVGAYTEKLAATLKGVETVDFSLYLIEGEKIPKNCNLIHYPYFDLFWLTLPLEKPLPTVVTIHDVTPLIFPNKFPKGIKGWLKFQLQKLSLRGVSAVITDSKNSKKDIIKYLNFPKKRIFVVPLAPGKEFKLIRSTTLLNRNIVKYNLPEKFVLYVGDVNWNKNLEGLIRAISNIKYQISNIKLVLVGKAFEDKNLEETRLILQLIKELNLINQIKILGFVPQDDLVAIYNLATVYCQPSFYEGFGLPVLEAMACGCPVVAAKTSSLPEVCGKAALMVDPHDINDIAEKIWGVISDEKIKDKLVRQGSFQAKQFSWEKTAYETYKVYRKVVGE